MNYLCKICDSVHGFVRFGEIENELIHSAAFQRLHYIHQMGVAYLVYPGATHSRFEHSLGVMELTTRIYTALIAPHHRLVPLSFSPKELSYWELIARLAALCHDLGHLPFSHTAEKALLPEGGHEQMTEQLIGSPELVRIWKRVGATAEADILKVALSERGAHQPLSSWEQVLSQIITEDNFGADRIDYLIRDGLYTGVGYGHFDYHQLIDCLRILPDPERGLSGLSLGVTVSGIQSVEALWIARYMMYARVYQHPRSKAYTQHMKRFMQRHYRLPFTSLEEYLYQTDYTLLTALAEAARKADPDARSLLNLRPPWSTLFLKQPLTIEQIEELEQRYQEDILIDRDELKQSGKRPAFAVYTDQGKLLSSKEASPFLSEIPFGTHTMAIYVNPERRSEIEKWILSEDP